MFFSNDIKTEKQKLYNDILQKNIKTPYYLIDETKLLSNLNILQEIKNKTGCKILLAQKAFSCYSLYPLISKYLDGTCSSGINEARLAFEHFGKEVHVFSTAFREEEFLECLKYADHFVFNSINQKNLYLQIANNNNKIVGMRVNPQISTQKYSIYDPCCKYSRLGILENELNKDDFKYISGLHFHVLCEQNSDALEISLNEFIKKFSKYFKYLKWVNFGGGHNITKTNYNKGLLIDLINNFKNKYNLEVYLEPGEAVVYDCGFLVASVLDIKHNEKNIAIIDASAACHMPDCLEMPYKPEILGSNEKGKFSYIIASNTCLAGDVLGEYNFENQININDKLIFRDMAMYTMVKNNTFNGMNLPSIILKKLNGEIKIIKEFNYNDFKRRL